MIAVPGVQIACNSYDGHHNKRQTEFAAGRLAAAQALAQLSATDTHVGTDGRLPLWPSGYLGSISHSHGIAGAAVARSTEIVCIGFDIERVMSAERAKKIQHRIATVAELARFDAPFAEAMTIVFAFKESVFKALYATEHRVYEFLDAEIIEVHDSQVVIAVSGLLLQGHLALEDDYVFALTLLAV